MKYVFLIEWPFRKIMGRPETADGYIAIFHNGAYADLPVRGLIRLSDSRETANRSERV